MARICRPQSVPVLALTRSAIQCTALLRLLFHRPVYCPLQPISASLNHTMSCINHSYLQLVDKPSINLKKHRTNYILANRIEAPPSKKPQGTPKNLYICYSHPQGVLAALLPTSLFIRRYPTLFHPPYMRKRAPQNCTFSATQGDLPTSFFPCL